MVLNNVRPPIIRDSDVRIAQMVDRMLQPDIEVFIVRRHIQQSVAREARHLAGVSASLSLLRLRLVPLANVAGF